MQTTESSIVKWGNSQGVRIPKKMLDILGLKDNDKIELSLEASGIMIKPIQKKFRNLKERVEEFYQVDFEKAIAENPYCFDEVDFGKPVGEEVW